ncbi:MAG: hypothetical protein ABI885_02020 [Gammaproteobacteria bacterium]
MPNPRETQVRVTCALLALVTMTGLGVARADFKTTAPKELNLSALWKLNPDLSDDPQKVVAKKRDEGMDPGPPPTGRGSRGGNNGIDVGDIFGGGTISGTLGGGRRGGTRGGAGDRPDDDPEPTGSMRVPLDSFLATREQFEIEQRPDALTIRTYDETNTCKPGESAKVRLSNGDAVDQRCGWQGDTFVTELKAADGVTRVNRYELRKGGKQLVMISEIKGGRGQLRGLQIRRVYDRLVAF